MIINKELYKRIDIWLKDNLEEDVFLEIGCMACSMPYDDIELEDTFTAKLLKIIDSKGLSDPEVYNKALVDRRVFSKIRSNNNYKPKKNTVLALSIALKLNIDELEDLLSRAGYSLSKSDRKDAIIRYIIENEEDYDVSKIDEVLTYYKLETLIKY